jgi:hypothetical protein
VAEGMSTKKVTTIEDANIVAYLVLRGFIAIPFIQTEKGVDAEIKMYYSNDKVGVHDYVRVLKDVRSSMYSVKQINNQLKGRRE